jgi:hypothetical protein
LKKPVGRVFVPPPVEDCLPWDRIRGQFDAARTTAPAGVFRWYRARGDDTFDVEQRKEALVGIEKYGECFIPGLRIPLPDPFPWDPVTAEHLP